MNKDSMEFVVYLIHACVEGVQYLDHKVLAQILEETEPDILRNAVRLPG